MSAIGSHRPCSSTFSSITKTGYVTSRISFNSRISIRSSLQATDAQENSQRKVDVGGKTIIVTGANTGMGLVTAKTLALKGANVILACRSPEKGLATQEVVWREMKAKGSTGFAEFAQLDLSSLASVRKFVDWFTAKYSSLDCLINNAGIMIPPHSYTEDGFESQFQVNHLSHYLLTRLLLDSLMASSSTPSVIHISSLAGERAVIQKGEFDSIARRSPATYDAWTAYRQSKLAQVLFTVEMNRRFGEKVTVNAVHPGIVNTDLFNRNTGSLIKPLLLSLGWIMETTGSVYSAEKGASTALYLATSSRDAVGSGGYFADCAPKLANPLAFDTQLGEEWWEESARAAGLDS